MCSVIRSDASRAVMFTKSTKDSASNVRVELYAWCYSMCEFSSHVDRLFLMPSVFMKHIRKHETHV